MLTKIIAPGGVMYAEPDAVDAVVPYVDPNSGRSILNACVLHLRGGQSLAINLPQEDVLTQLGKLPGHLRGLDDA